MFQTLVNVGVFFGATWVVSKTNTQLGSVSKDLLTVAGSTLSLAQAATHSVAQAVDSITQELQPNPTPKKATK